MNDNIQTLNTLFETNRIDLQRSALFDTPPNSMLASIDWLLNGLHGPHEQIQR